MGASHSSNKEIIRYKTLNIIKYNYLFDDIKPDSTQIKYKIKIWNYEVDFNACGNLIIINQYDIQFIIDKQIQLKKTKEELKKELHELFKHINNNRTLSALDKLVVSNILDVFQTTVEHC